MCSVTELHQIPAHQKAKFLQDLEADPKTRQRVGDGLVLLLERFDDLEKPAMLAKVFAGYVRGDIGFEKFRRLGRAIDMGYIEDLSKLAFRTGSFQRGIPSHFVSLLGSGLTEVDEQVMVNQHNAELGYSVSSLGQDFIRLVGGHDPFRK